MTQVELFWGDSGLMERRVKNGAGWRDYYVTTDDYGNVTQLIRADTRLVVARYNYDAFGGGPTPIGAPASYDALDQDQVNQPYRYQSHWRDSNTGLIDFGYRFYSPSLGRFFNQDPLEEGGGINLYAFVNGDPTNLLDPFGLSPCYDNYGYQYGGKQRPGQLPSTSSYIPDADFEIGVKTGFAAIGSAATLGRYSGNEYANKPGFGTSKVLAYGGFAAGAIAGGVAVAGVGGTEVTLGTIIRGGQAVGRLYTAHKTAKAAIDGAAGALGKDLDDEGSPKSSREIATDVIIGAGMGVINRDRNAFVRVGSGFGSAYIKHKIENHFRLK